MSLLSTLQTPNPNPNPLHTERGLTFSTGSAFFRRESSLSRDLAVLSAALLPTPTTVLDAMCGSGVRALRYLSQSNAAFVWANDANEELRGVVTENLTRAGEGKGRWVVTHWDARRVMEEWKGERFGLVDVDSFGGNGRFLRAAVEVVREGGLVYVTCTDGFSSGGHRPEHSLASYGAYVRPMPYSNEVGLRMLIGGVLREAAVLGFHAEPLFSYYSYHGPVFRVMLRITHEKLKQDGNYGFIGYCTRCGDSRAFSFSELGLFCCPCSGREVSHSLKVSGPVWTGPLHNGTYLNELFELAQEWGWLHSGKEGTALEKLLKRMIDESDPQLPFGYIKLDEIASRAKLNSPPLSTIINTLKQKGYAASRSHIKPDAVKTNCPMSICVQVAKQIRNGPTVSL